VHEGGFEVEVTDTGLLFRAPDGTALPEAPVPARAEGPPLEERNTCRGLRIDKNTGVPRWDGTRLDAVYVCDVLFRNWELARRDTERAREPPA
jgi:hypothetical protein